MQNKILNLFVISICAFCLSSCYTAAVAGAGAAGGYVIAEENDKKEPEDDEIKN